MNKFSGWRAGRMDAVSYDGDGDGPYKQVYVDNPEGRMHMGKRLPDVVCKVFGVQGADCREVATLVAAAPDLLAACKMALEKLDRAGASDYKPVDLEAHPALVAAIAKAEPTPPPDADDPDDTILYTDDAKEG